MSEPTPVTPEGDVIGLPPAGPPTEDPAPEPEPEPVMAPPAIPAPGDDEVDPADL